MQHEEVKKEVKEERGGLLKREKERISKKKIRVGEQQRARSGKEK